MLGAIAQGAREHLPITWDALEVDRRYGERLLQGRVDLVKFRLFGEVVAPAVEGSTYDPIVVDYAAKSVVLELSSPGADYWASMASSFSAENRQETKLYIDRAQAIWRLHDRLMVETRAMWDDVRGRLGIRLRVRPRSRGIVVSEPGDDFFVTPSPNTFERPYAVPELEGTQ